MSKVLDTVRTSVAGCAMGEDIEIEGGKTMKYRQLALKFLAHYRAQDPSRRILLSVVPDPENKFDPNALQLITDIPEMGGRVQLGFIRNAGTVCGFCLREFPKFPPGGKCPACGRNDHLERKGLATQLAEAMRANPTLKYYAEVLEVTGGTQEKAHYGCNIEVRRYTK